MENKKKIETAKSEAPEKAPSSWGWIVPGIIGMILVKTLGLVGALVTMGSYFWLEFWLQPKIGTLGAIVLSAVLGIASGVGVVILILN